MDNLQEADTHEIRTGNTSYDRQTYFDQTELWLPQYPHFETAFFQECFQVMARGLSFQATQCWLIIIFQTAPSQSLVQWRLFQLAVDGIDREIIKIFRHLPNPFPKTAKQPTPIISESEFQGKVKEVGSTRRLTRMHDYPEDPELPDSCLV